MNSRPGGTTAAGLTAGNMDISHISLIHGRPSPPPRWDSTPHTPTPTLQQVLDPTKNERHKHKRMARVARYHSYGEGYEQAGRRSPPPRWNPTAHTTTLTLQQTHDRTKNAKLKHKHLARPARYDSLREGHEQVRSARVEQGIGQVQQLRLTNKDRKKIPAEHKTPRPDNTQAAATAQYTHSTLLKSSNRPMAAARKRQGQQLYASHGTPNRRPQTAPPFSLTLAGEVIQPEPPALLPEAWPSECNTTKAKQPKRDKVFLNTTHY